MGHRSSRYIQNASYLDSLKDFAHARGLRLPEFNAGNIGGVGLYAGLAGNMWYKYMDNYVRQRMPWFSINHRPGETNVPYMPRGYNLATNNRNIPMTRQDVRNALPFVHDPGDFRKRRAAFKFTKLPFSSGSFRALNDKGEITRTGTAHYAVPLPIPKDHYSRFLQSGHVRLHDNYKNVDVPQA